MHLHRDGIHPRRDSRGYLEEERELCAVLGQKASIMSDIHQYVFTLRNLQPLQKGFMSSALQNPATDNRVGSRYLGPMNHTEFHSMLQRHLRSEDIHLLGKAVAHTKATQYRTCCTHGDLLPRNILVINGRIVALIDWAFSGWYPETGSLLRLTGTIATLRIGMKHCSKQFRAMM
jgi:thiamine kinase-like enzyme